MRARGRNHDHEHPSGRKSEDGALAGDGKVYVNLTDTNELVEIDAKANDRGAALVNDSV